MSRRVCTCLGGSVRGFGLRLSGATASPLEEVVLRYMCRGGAGHEPTRIAQYAAIYRY